MLCFNVYVDVMQHSGVLLYVRGKLTYLENVIECHFIIDQISSAFFMDTNGMANV